MYLKPFRPTFQELQEVEALPSGRTRLQQTGAYVDALRAFEKLNPDEDWDLRFFEKHHNKVSHCNA